MKEGIDKQIVYKIMDRAAIVQQGCTEECRDFRVMESPMRPGELILRWTTIDINDIDRPLQCYHYECFDKKGEPQDCSVHYADNDEANEFFWTLKTVYQQILPGTTNSRRMYSLKNVDPQVLSKVKVPNQEEIVKLTREKLDPKKAYDIIKQDTKGFTVPTEKAMEVDRLFVELLENSGITVPRAEDKSGAVDFVLEEELEQERARALALLELELEMQGKL